MTVPRERSQAVRNTRVFLHFLLDPKKYPKVPKAVRLAAYWCLRHYPSEYEMDKVAKKSPEVFESLTESEYASD